MVDEPTNVLDNYEIHLNGESAQVVDNKAHSHRMYEEFVTFNKMIEQHDLIEAQKRMKHSLDVMKVVDSALSDSGIKLG